VSENSTPVRWYVHLDYDDADSPQQFIGNQDFAEVLEVLEDPIKVDMGWKVGPQAEMVVNLLNSAPAV